MDAPAHHPRRRSRQSHPKVRSGDRRRGPPVQLQGSHWRSGFQQIRPGVRSGLTQAWRSKTCVACGKIRYAWIQTRISVASRDKSNPKKWVVRSYSLKKRDLYLSSRAAISLSIPIGKKPVVRCMCPGKNGLPSPSVVRLLAQRWFPPREFQPETI